MKNFIDVYGNADITPEWLAMDDFVDYVYGTEKPSLSDRIRLFFGI